MHEYKGIYYGENNEQHFYEGGEILNILNYIED